MSGRIDYRIWQWAARSLRDESVIGLLISNIIIIIWALYAKWDVPTRISVLPFFLVLNTLAILETAKPPRVLTTPEDDKLVLSSGQVISLSSHPQIQEHLQSILQLPLEVQEEVCRGLMAKEDDRGQPRRQFECCCSKAGKISGPGVPAYVEGHLRLLWKMDDGSQLYVCPQTGTRWVRTNDTLKAKQ